MLVLLITLLFSFPNDHKNLEAVDLSGVWNITGTVVTTTSRDPTAPQPGSQMVDVWTITLTNGIPRLKTKAGSVDGTIVNETYHFEGQVTIYPNPLVWMTFKIDILPSTAAGQIYGTETLTYFGLDGVRNPHLLGTESWTFTGIKQ
jgi:hypothetical protein